MRCLFTVVIILVCVIHSSLVLAGEVTIRRADFERKSPGVWRVSVTLSHADRGFKHFADRWKIVDEQGLQLGIRVLQHPHDLEQPFTRSLTNVVIPEETKIVYIEARDNQHGWAPQRLKVNLAKVVNGRLRVKR